ncbi:RNA helicase [Fusarium albosuccineum]|uniref:RNA helicase n=1 Tax=Fusarium albosuccineum TaxID=1237068 RepID=A0A8H4KHT1_9HYPO|nr:RNA helicase [Fusarium albosuccineum]
MEHRSRIRERSPRREHDSRDRPERRSQDRDAYRRNTASRSRSPAYKRAKTSSSSRHDRHSNEPSGRHPSSKHRSSHRHRDHRSRTAETSVKLPFNARPLSKGDLPAFEPLFADYLSLQKQKDIEEMDDREVRGRWKSFVGKWNRGELAEGWYDPEMFARVSADNQGAPPARNSTGRKDEREERANGGDDDDKERDVDSEDEDDYGPTLPTSDRARRSGPGIPTLQDLSLRAELAEEDKQASVADLRSERKADRTLQRERLDELVPRAEPGTRERMLEKRAAVADKMRSFRDKSPGAMEVGDERELMGGGDSLDEYKKAKENEQRRKTEREIRREEIERAKREEIEEKRRAWREREEGTMGMLKELARQRFG